MDLDINNLDINSKVTLNNGVDMPRLGFGTARMRGDTARKAVEAALKAGYLSIDTSKNYYNEESVGEAIRSGAVPRTDLFVTTKLETEDHGYDGALRGIEGSLERLGLAYVDLYLIHSPGPDRQRQDTWRGMAELLNQGKARSIGVSNFGRKELEDILEMDLVVPQVNQVELHPMNYLRQLDLINFCEDNITQIEAYSPLDVGGLLDHRTVKEIAGHYNKTPAQVLLRWSLQHGFVAIPKSDDPAHIRANANIFDFEMWDEDMDQLDALSGSGTIR